MTNYAILNYSIAGDLSKQIIYKFDEKRYLLLEGENCQGGLWYYDFERNIYSEVVSSKTPIFKISHYRFIHPSQRYISIPWHDGSGFIVSKDYGRTWGQARFISGGGIYRNASDSPQVEDIESMTVINDQAFINTYQHDLYISSKPFDDPRLEPDGAGIDYNEKTSRGILSLHIYPGYGGGKWGKTYTSWASVQKPRPRILEGYQANWEDISATVLELKNHTGWDRMQCLDDDPAMLLTSEIKNDG